jgi:signal transduction histidine kinase
MLEKKYKNIVYLIAFTILATIVAQVYWNKKVYDINKQQVINQIQSSFDDSVEKYFSEIAKNDVVTIVKSDTILNREIELNVNSENFTSDVWLQGIGDSVAVRSKERLLHPTFNNQGSIILRDIDTSDHLQFAFLKRKIDSLDIKQFTSKILFSFIMDDLELEKIDSLLSIELERKNINIQYGFQFIDKNTLDNKLEIEDYQLEGVPTNYLSAIANSPFIMAHSTLELRYTNATISILRKMMGSILLSLLLSGIIIGCLLFLLKIISKQKQLAEVKNDIISNITHEFKTPISTIGVAIESIKNFNVIDDKEKTKKYLDISNDQLSKLNMMVEKLLETATLDSENLELSKDEIDVSDLVQNLVDKLQLQTNEKVITYKKSEVPILANVDVFHFENAINNIIDNAIKYGGNEIFVDLKQQESNFTIDISDSGNSIPKEHSKQIFEKFYRISKGNTHDVKGFGIGLYYCKKIIEKHRGTIQLVLENKLTSFKISLPNE